MLVVSLIVTILVGLRSFTIATILASYISLSIVNKLVESLANFLVT